MPKLHGMPAWLLTAAAIILLCAHGAVLYRVSSAPALGIAAASGAILLVLIKVGLLIKRALKKATSNHRTHA